MCSTIKKGIEITSHAKTAFKIPLHVCNKLTKCTNQSRTNGPINAHLTIAQVMPRYNHNNEKQEAFL